jgi:hypothetical protein
MIKGSNPDTSDHQDKEADRVYFHETFAQLANHLTTDHKVRGLHCAITSERSWCTHVAHLLEGFNPNQMIKGSNTDTSQHRDKKAEKVCILTQETSNLAKPAFLLLFNFSKLQTGLIKLAQR